MKVIRQKAFRDSALRNFCRRALHGHSKKMKGQVVCILPTKVIGEKVMRNAMTYLAHRHLMSVLKKVQLEHHDEELRYGRESIPPGRLVRQVAGLAEVNLGKPMTRRLLLAMAR